MGDATNKVADGEPEPAVRASSTRNAGTANVFPMQFDTAQAAFLAGYLAAGMTQDRQGRHLRRPEDPAGDHLHGRLRRRRGALQQGQEQERPGAGLGQGQAERLLHRTTSSSRTRARRSPTRWSPRAPTSIMPVAGGAGLGTTAAAKASGGKYSVIWVDVDGCESTAQTARSSSPPWSRTSRTPSRTPCVKAAGGEKLPADPGLPRHPGQQRRLAGPVPRVRQQGPGRPEGRGRQAQGGHHRRHRSRSTSAAQPK